MQVLSTRKRKDVEVADIKVQVCLFAFDCLYLNGEMLLQRPLTERRKALLEAVKEKPGELQYALYKVQSPAQLPRCNKTHDRGDALRQRLPCEPCWNLQEGSQGSCSNSVQDCIHLMLS